MGSWLPSWQAVPNKARRSWRDAAVLAGTDAAEVRRHCSWCGRSEAAIVGRPPEIGKQSVPRLYVQLTKIARASQYQSSI